LRWFYGRLVLALLAATALSFVAGFVVAEIAGNFPCEGEGLACNIDSAVGGYGVILSAALGPIVLASRFSSRKAGARSAGLSQYCLR
jgi:nitrate/nitrite transporter NarK